jgi:hypothetical protein
MRYNFQTVHLTHAMYTEHKLETMVKLLNGVVTSDLYRPLGVEIDKPPLLTSGKTRITCERYAIDAKHTLNTDRKPWSTKQLVTSFPVCDVI